MTACKYFYMALAMAVVAVAIQLASMSEAGRSLELRATAVSLPEARRALARREAETHSEQAGILAYVGFAIAAFSIASSVASARRREPARRIVIIGLLASYALLQCVLI